MRNKPQHWVCSHLFSHIFWTNIIPEGLRPCFLCTPDPPTICQMGFTVIYHSSEIRGLCLMKLSSDPSTSSWWYTETENFLALKIINLRSNLKVYTGIKKKNHTKKIFYVGGNLSFGLFFQTRMELLYKNLLE